MASLTTRKTALAGLWTAALSAFALAAAPVDAVANERAASSERDGARLEHRIVVDRFEGRGGAVPRAGAIYALEKRDEVDLVSVRRLEENKALLDGTPAGYVRLARRLGLTAIVRAEVEASDGEFRLTLTVLDGRTGGELGTLNYSAKSLPALREKLRGELWGEIRPLLEKQRASGAKAGRSDEQAAQRDEPEKTETEAEPETEESSAGDAADEAEKTAGEKAPPAEPGSRCDWVRLEVRAGTLSRWFDYEVERRGALRALKLRPVPTARLGATLFPFARRTCGSLSGLGLSLAYEQPFGVRAELAGRSLDTRAFGTSAELLWRIPIGRFSVTPKLGHGWDYFAIEDDFVPDASDHALRLGLDLGGSFGWFFGEIGAGYRYLVGIGELASEAWFPNAQGFGYDLAGRIGVRPLSWLELLAGLEFREYRFTLEATGAHPYPNGVADGAFDRSLRGYGAVRFYLR